MASDRMPTRQVLAAMSAVLVGIGFARFAYAPLLPVLISHGWFAPAAAAYLGAANLLGYLAGALAARHAAARLPTPGIVRGAMLAAALSLAACCMPLPFLWFFAWRLVSGIAGGLLMILAPSCVMAHVPHGRRGLASGLMITGVGLGIAASGTLVPVLLRWGLPEAWLGLAAVALALTLASWRAWPAAPPAAAASASPDRARFGIVSTSYGLCAVSMVPHMVFLADFVARGLGRGIDAGAFTWVLYGLGALSGAVVAGRLADGIGAAATMRTIIGVQGVVLAVLLLSRDPLAVAVSSVFAGMLGPAISAVMLERVGRMADGHPLTRQRGWTQATVAWALGQAAGGYGMAWLYGAADGYTALFATALAALAAAAVVEIMLMMRPIFSAKEVLQPVTAPDLPPSRREGYD